MQYLRVVIYFSGKLLVITEIKNVKFTVGGEFFFVVFSEAYNFSDLIICGDGIDRSGCRICGWCKWVSVVDRIKILCSEYHSEET